MLFGLKMNNYCKENTGISKKLNIGIKKNKGYEIIIDKLRLYLEGKGIITESTYMFLEEEEKSDIEDELER